MTQVIPVSAATQTQFDVGDGSTTAFLLPPQAAADFFGAPSIYKTDYLGNFLLSAAPRINFIRNNTGVGATAGTPGVAPTNWTVGSGGGVSSSIVGSGIEAGIAYVDVRFYGTAVGVLYLDSFFETSAAIPAAAGQVWTCSAYMRLVGGSYANVSATQLVFEGVNSSGSGTEGPIVVSPVLTNAALNTQRVTGTGRMVAASTAFGRPYYQMVTAAGPIDITVRIGLPQAELSSVATYPIATYGNATPYTDYSISSVGVVNLTTAPFAGALLLWSGTYLYVPAATVASLVQETLLSQYANSPTLLQLINNWETYINPAASLNAFYTQIWDVLTATGFGLDIWGKIVGISRQIKIAGTALDFGFKEGTGQPFGQAPFNGGTASSNTYTLSDTAFRTLILVKALSNISNSTALSYNNLLQNLFAGRGRCYVTDTGQMQILFTFEFNLQPYEISIITNSGAFPRPAAVKANLFAAVPASTFGFNEGMVWQSFGQGVFANSSQLINVA
jgi:hypothetical protein